MDFRILGRLEVVDDGVDVAPRRAQPRALLAMFLLHPNELLTADRLIEALWGDTPPATADKALQGHVSALRKALGHERLATERGGYRLLVRPGELDADRFATAVTAARAMPDPARSRGGASRTRSRCGAASHWRISPASDSSRPRSLASTPSARRRSMLGRRPQLAAGHHAGADTSPGGSGRDRTPTARACAPG